MRERGRGERDGTVSNMFLVLSLFCRRNSSLKQTKNDAASKADLNEHW